MPLKCQSNNPGYASQMKNIYESLKDRIIQLFQKNEYYTLDPKLYSSCLEMKKKHPTMKLSTTHRAWKFLSLHMETNVEKMKTIHILNLRVGFVRKTEEGGWAEFGMEIKKELNADEKQTMQLMGNAIVIHEHKREPLL